jgi:hypothetical protein
MDPLQSLISNAPDWVKRLDELNQQVEQRQRDLAKFDEIHSQSSVRSIRNKGSTESLKPKDEGPAHSPHEPTPQSMRTPPRSTVQPASRQTNPPSPESNGRTPSFVQRQTNEIAACAQKRARAVLRKRPKTESMISGEGLTTTYRSRSMIIVYYDSYVQSFFEELVKFVSAQRNLMRKAKMAAKVAEIKRLAELEMPDDEEEEGDDDVLQPGDTLIAADPKLAARRPGGTRMDDTHLRYLSTRLMGPTLRASNGLLPVRSPNGGMGLDALGRGLNALDSGPGDIFDELDRALEFVQGMCERAAHQFLRDGDCADEIEKIKRRLEQTKEGAEKELDRLAKEAPNGTPKEAEPPKFRSYRPSTMRRDPGASASSKKKNRVEVDDDEGVQDI